MIDLKRGYETDRHESGGVTLETFASKVRHGTGVRFDPMMEERGG